MMKMQHLTDQELRTGLLELVICAEERQRITKLIREKPQYGNFPVVESLEEARRMSALFKERTEWEARANNVCYELIDDGAPLNCFITVKRDHKDDDERPVVALAKVRLYKDAKNVAMHQVVL